MIRTSMFSFAPGGSRNSRETIVRPGTVRTTQPGSGFAQAALSGSAAFAARVALAALPILIAPAGAALAAIPAPGTDVLPAAGSIEITVDGIGTDYVRLVGGVSIVRHPPAQPPPDDGIPIEIVSLSLSGSSALFGVLGINPCTAPPSTGQTLRMMGVESPSGSYFDVYLDITLADLGRTLAGGPFRIEAQTTAVPFLDVFAGTVSQNVPLVDLSTGMPAGTLSHLSLDPNPRVDIMTTEATLDWTIGGAGGGGESIALSGRTVLVASDSFTQPPPDDQTEFNTEIVAMDLSGVSPAWGDALFTERIAIHSPGRTSASPGPAQFPADSFFDLSFDLDTPSFQLSCQTPLNGTAAVDGWPPFGISYASSGPCDLYQAGATQPIGTVDSFSWTWIEVAERCVDADGDGVAAPPCGTDCDDGDPDNYPGNLEACSDGQDNNCNLAADCLDPLCLGLSCDDGSLCTTGDSCADVPGIGLICQGAPRDCDDGDLCTADPCDPGTGTCLNPPVSCDDGNLCTDDACDPVSGLCVNAPVSCDDGDPCTDDACEPVTGACMPAPKVCDDFSLCTNDSCQAQVCVVPDNGSGTADLPAPCPHHVDERQTTPLTTGELFFTDIVAHQGFACPPATPAVCSFPSPVPGVECSQPGGALGGEQGCAESFLTLRFTIYDPLTGNSDSRTVDLPISFEMHSAPRIPGDPVQSFATNVYRMFGEITAADADPDFDLLRVTAGSDFGMPGPGHATLTQVSGGWEVDSLFDITFQLEMVGAPGSFLAGQNQNNQRTLRFSTGGGCLYPPIDCDDADLCSIDSCDPGTGACQHAPQVCSDDDRCTADSCDPANGQCQFTPLGCDDADLCTTDLCDPIDGCLHLPAVPLEPAPLLFLSQTQFAWPATQDATHWNAYRGTIPAALLGSRLPGAEYDHLCHESADALGDGALVSTDTGDPSLGTAFYYLETGEGVCGESVPGHSSSAVIPILTPCPTPP